jgi:hypothetical protein
LKSDRKRRNGTPLCDTAFGSVLGSLHVGKIRLNR